MQFAIFPASYQKLKEAGFPVEKNLTTDIFSVRLRRIGNKLPGPEKVVKKIEQEQLKVCGLDKHVICGWSGEHPCYVDRAAGGGTKLV